MGLRRRTERRAWECHPKQCEAARPTESPGLLEYSGSEAAGGNIGSHAEIANEQGAGHVDSMTTREKLARIRHIDTSEKVALTQ